LSYRPSRIIFTLLTSAIGATPADPASLVAHYHSALEHNIAYQSSQIDHQVTASELDLATSAFFPRLHANASYAQVQHDSKRSTQAMSLQLQQPLLQLPAIYQYQRIKLTHSQSQLAIQQAKASLIFSTAKAYLQVLTHHEQSLALQQEKQELTHKVKQAKAKQEVGLTTGLALLQAQTALAAINAQIRLTEQAQQTAAQHLTELTGLSATPTPKGHQQQPIPPILGDIDSWQEQAQQHSLALQIAALQVDQQAALTQAQQSKYWPTVTANAQLARNINKPASQMQPTETNRSAQITITQTLYDGGQRHAELAKAKQLQHKQQLALQQLEQDIREQIHQAWHQVHTQADVIAAEKIGLTSANALVHVAEQSLQVGTGTMENVLTALTQQREATQRLTQATYQYITQQLQLKFISGIISEADLTEIDHWLSDERKR